MNNIIDWIWATPLYAMAIGFLASLMLAFGSLCGICYAHEKMSTRRERNEVREMQRLSSIQ